MKWLTNLFDPNHPDAKRGVTRRFDETPEEAWNNQVLWLSDKIIGEPKATKHHSVDELKEMNLVGVYKND